MPLPNAEPPEKSRLYEELKSKTALPSASGGVTADLIDNLKNATYLDADNEDQLRRLLLLQQVTGTGSSSGPLADSTAKTFYVSATNSGTKYTILQPNVGEVYLLGPCSFQLGSPTGSVTVEQWIYAPDQVDGTSRRVLVGNSSSSSSSYTTIYEGGPNTPIYVDYGSKVSVEATGTFTSVSFFLYAIRVR